MVFTFASAGWQSHSREVVYAVDGALIGCNTNVAFVMVTVRPKSVTGCEITWSSEISHGPETRPKPDRVTTTGQRDTGLQMAALVTHLVPRLDHAGSIVKTVVLECIESNVEGTVFGRNCVGIVPL